MTWFFKQYTKNAVLCELGSALIIIAILVLSAYFLYLHQTFTHYQHSVIVRNHTITTLHFKKQQQITEHHTITALSQWQHQHPVFFNTLQSQLTTNRIIHYLTNTIHDNGLTMATLKTHNKTVDITLKGDFAQLLSLLQSMQKTPYPVTLNKLVINQDAVFMLQYQIGGTRD